MKMRSSKDARLHRDPNRGDRISVNIWGACADRNYDRDVHSLGEPHAATHHPDDGGEGQPIPAELLAPAARAVRRRSDVRRGVIWAWLASV